MSAVSTTEAWPARGQPFTVSDLDRLPDDGRRETLSAERPFRVEVVPATLLARLPGRHP